MKKIVFKEVVKQPWEMTADDAADIAESSQKFKSKKQKEDAGWAAIYKREDLIIEAIKRGESISESVLNEGLIKNTFSETGKRQFRDFLPDLVKKVSGRAKKITKSKEPTKQPWEMTREEYATLSIRREGQRLARNRQTNPAERKRIVAQGERRIKRGDLGLVVKGTNKRSQWGQFIDEWRERDVRKAFSEGKLVSASVLKDYPNLVKNKKPAFDNYPSPTPSASKKLGEFVYLAKDKENAFGIFYKKKDHNGAFLFVEETDEGLVKILIDSNGKLVTFPDSKPPNCGVWMQVPPGAKVKALKFVTEQRIERIAKAFGKMGKAIGAVSRGEATSVSVLKDKIRELNKDGARLRLCKNKQLGVAGVLGIDKDPFLLIGKDNQGRSLKIKGDAAFIEKTIATKPSKQVTPKVAGKQPKAKRAAEMSLSEYTDYAKQQVSELEQIIKECPYEARYPEILEGWRSAVKDPKSRHREIVEGALRFKKPDIPIEEFFSASVLKDYPDLVTQDKIKDSVILKVK